MTPTYDKVVEKVAECIFIEYYPCGYNEVSCYAESLESQKENLRRNAKAAIRAMQDMMPEVEYYGGYETDAPELYEHFKTMGRK